MGLTYYTVKHHTGETHMKNVKLAVAKNTLTITVDLSKTFGPSASGKSILIASTEGNKGVPGRDEVRLGLNVYCAAQSDSTKPTHQSK